MKGKPQIKISIATSGSGNLARIIGGIKKSRRLKLAFISILSVVAVTAAIIIILNTSSGAKQVSNTDPVVTGESAVTPAPSSIPTTTQTPDPTLKSGDNNEQVELLQKRLMDLGYLDIPETTTKFGPMTKRAVEYFQRQQGLPLTGIADPETLSYIYSGEAQPYMLLKGSRGADVNTLQRQLIDLGYLNKATGYYGDDTEGAVKAFQKENKLDIDGKTGPDTLDLISSPDAKMSPEKRKELRTQVNIEKMIQIAEKQVGKPYVGGNEGPNSFDCSGLVYYCLKNAGSNRGRYNAQGYSAVKEWTKIEKWEDLKRGDLMFFWIEGRHKIGHVAIYIGDGMIIEAMDGVEKHLGTSRWYRSTFRFGRRPWEIP